MLYVYWKIRGTQRVKREIQKRKDRDNRCFRSKKDWQIKEVYLEKRQAELASAEFLKTVFISKSKVVDADLVYYLPDLFDERLYK